MTTHSSDDGHGAARARETLYVLYQENGQMCRMLLEWRYRVLLRFFVTIGALLAIAGWVYEQTESIFLLSILPLTASLMSALSFLMDRVNRNGLDKCYTVGAEIESRMAMHEGYYTKEHTNNGWLTYSAILTVIYLATAAVCLLIAVILPMVAYHA